MEPETSTVMESGRETMDTFVVMGSSPEEPAMAPFETYLRRKGAEAYLLQGLIQSFGVALQGFLSEDPESGIQPGGTVSLIVSLGNPTDENPFPTSSGSFAVNNPNDRRVWDFIVLPHTATPKDV